MCGSQTRACPTLTALLPAGLSYFEVQSELHISVYIYEAHLHLAEVAESVTGHNGKASTLSRRKVAAHLEAGYPSWKVIQQINPTSPAASVAAAVKQHFF